LASLKKEVKGWHKEIKEIMRGMLGGLNYIPKGRGKIKL
jgi:hypothetical protein